jgi:hypothetical protein
VIHGFTQRPGANALSIRSWLRLTARTRRLVPRIGYEPFGPHTPAGPGSRRFVIPRVGVPGGKGDHCDRPLPRVAPVLRLHNRRGGEDRKRGKGFRVSNRNTLSVSDPRRRIPASCPFLRYRRSPIKIELRSLWPSDLPFGLPYRTAPTGFARRKRAHIRSAHRSPFTPNHRAMAPAARRGENGTSR